MVKLFRSATYKNNVENMINAIHSWLENGGTINTKKPFIIKIEQNDNYLKEDIETYKKREEIEKLNKKFREWQKTNLKN